MLSWIKANPGTVGKIAVVILVLAIIAWPLPHNDTPNPQQGDLDYATNWVAWLWGALLPMGLKVGVLVGIYLYLKRSSKERGKKTRQVERDTRLSERVKNEQKKGREALRQLEIGQEVFDKLLNSGNAGRNVITEDKYGRLHFEIVQEKIPPK